LRDGDDGSADDGLLDLLPGDIATEPDPEIEAAWLEEVRRRMRDSAEGRVEAIPGEEVLAKARERVQEAVLEEPKAELGLERAG
jgi:broad specificity phosphatase PhoE